MTLIRPHILIGTGHDTKVDGFRPMRAVSKGGSAFLGTGDRWRVRMSCQQEAVLLFDLESLISSGIVCTFVWRHGRLHRVDVIFREI